MTRFTFQVGKAYKRSQIKEAIGLDPNAKGGPWDTGYAERDGADFIFCNIGTAGRTGHDYDNYFDGPDLVWRGKTNSHRTQPTIQRMTAPGAEVHVFWRSDERDPFTYAGIGTAVEVTDEKPVRVRWQFNGTSSNNRKDNRSLERLPSEALDKVSAEHVWKAVQMLLEGYADHQFAASTDYDLVAEDGERLPPKAVFGVAAKLALGFEVLPKHFTAGVTSTCFRILKEAGYPIVPKNEPLPEIPPPFSTEDQEWTEGKPKLVTHLVKERARGLSQAKRSQFKREHGKLYCEKCGLDPVEIYGTPHAEACIEVHHHEVHVRDMVENHRTLLESLQCLCANCHRLVHKLLREGVIGT
ncbi:hypothetical protein EDC30_102114 [Paucimonas lemoignei]|uniref:ScoMcrA-like N-terminal head domain-containing protein n=1 Tax=Paucimonas lemoignei TaxID=29443 RepID=A0A4R3HYD5_PAULE|nr:hypothetical protein [Paucimonas lemoignei]TCS38377.1 hypothetical protein EDC30_102114 [Paucimonas lemoignei]